MGLGSVDKNLRHELWVVTVGMRLKIQVTKISFLG